MNEPNQEIQVEIQKTLASINDVTIKIKKELMMILDLIRDEGRLGIAVKDANEVLAGIIQDMGIDMTVQSDIAEENEDQSDSLLLPVTPDLITKKLLSLMVDTPEQSKS